MPVYEYECESGHIVAVEHSITKEPLTACVKEGISGINGDLVICCSPCKRLIGCRTSFILAGSGWARDGYKSST